MVEIGTRLGIPYVSGQDKNTSNGRTLEVALSGGVVEGGGGVGNKFRESRSKRVGQVV